MVSIVARIAGLLSGGSEMALPRRAFLGAAVAGAALAVVPLLMSSSAHADGDSAEDGNGDPVGDAIDNLRKARRELVRLDHDHGARDQALQRIDQALAAASQIQR